MHPFDAYKRQKDYSMPRVDLTLALFRKALENLSKARSALAEQQPDAARPYLLNTQLIVTSLTAELPAYQDDAARNFLRLYEFVAYQMAQGSVASVDAATKVLRILQDAFGTVREQAIALEAQGVIPPLDRPREVSLTA